MYGEPCETEVSCTITPGTSRSACGSVRYARSRKRSAVTTAVEKGESNCAVAARVAVTITASSASSGCWRSRCGSGACRSVPADGSLGGRSGSWPNAGTASRPAAREHTMASGARKARSAGSGDFMLRRGRDAGEPPGTTRPAGGSAGKRRSGLRTTLAGRRRLAVPLVLGFAERTCGPAAEHEQQVGQAVQVSHALVDAVGLHGVQAHDAPLRATADGPGLVQERTDRTTSRQDELGERRQLAIESIAPLLEPLDLRRPDVPHRRVAVRGPRREVGTDVEQVVLHAP